MLNVLKVRVLILERYYWYINAVVIVLLISRTFTSHFELNDNEMSQDV